MDNKIGVLNEKLKNYYEDADIISYRHIFLEAVINYRGAKFDKILDIGSGIGIFLDSIEPFGYDRYALEASEYGLNRLNEKGIKSQEFFLEKDKKLPFGDKEFSFVLFNQVIEHLDKSVGEYYIKEIIRVLEPGGVAIIKSPSKYSKIWRTDPHHIYCWKPNELLNEVEQYSDIIENIKLQRVPLEPWMMFEYDDEIIDNWHKYNRYPKIKIFFHLVSKVFDKIVYKFNKNDFMLAVANVTFVKRYKI